MAMSHWLGIAFPSASLAGYMRMKWANPVTGSACVLRLSAVHMLEILNPKTVFATADVSVACAGAVEPLSVGRIDWPIRPSWTNNVVWLFLLLFRKGRVSFGLACEW